MQVAQPLFNDLFKRRASGIQPGLELIRALLGALGNPERQLRCIHIAGTNGKGSVAAMLSVGLTEGGLRTGCYTSPHLVRFTERFRLNDRDIDANELASVMQAVLDAEAALGDALPRSATFFELATAAAFLWFQQQAVDIAVIETGMGGRWDATNVMAPEVSVMMPVSMDHCNYLGSTLAAIAAEKCGIIKPGRPLVCAPQCPEVRESIQTVCRELKAPLIMVEDAVSVRCMHESLEGQRLKVESVSAHYPPVLLPLAGRIQTMNVAVAVAVMEVLQAPPVWEAHPDRIVEGLKKTRWPGRCQTVSKNPDVLVDGAHNTAGFIALTEWLQRIAGPREVRAVIGFLEDKPYAESLRILASKVRDGWTVTIDDPRAVAAEPLAEASRACGMRLVAADFDEAIEQGLQWAEGSGGLLLICGSLYLAGRALTRFHAI